MVLFLAVVFSYLLVAFCDPARDFAWTSVLIAVSLIAISIRRDPEYLRLTAAITVILALLYWLRYGFLGLRPGWEIAGYCSLFGIAAFLASVILSNGGRDTLRRVAEFYPAMVLCLFCLAANNLPRMLPTDRLWLRDFSLLELDRRVGLALTADAGVMFQTFPILKSLCASIYALVPVWIAVGAIFGKKRPNSYWLSILVATVFGSCAYRLVPAVGPFHIWGARFPAELASFNDYSRPLSIPSKLANCMPSLHATWAMLVFWNLWNREQKRLRVLGAAILGGTVLATLGLGEHYVIDIVVAVPFAYAIHCAIRDGLPWRAPDRLYPALVGALSFFTWEALLSTGAYRTTNIAFLYALVLISMSLPAAPLLRRHPLSRHESSSFVPITDRSD